MESTAVGIFFIWRWDIKIPKKLLNSVNKILRDFGIIDEIKTSYSYAYVYYSAHESKEHLEKLLAKLKELPDFAYYLGTVKGVELNSFRERKTGEVIDREHFPLIVDQVIEYIIKNR